MTAVFASIFFTVACGGAGTSLLLSLEEARRFFAQEGEVQALAPVEPRHRISIRRSARLSQQPALRAAA